MIVAMIGTSNCVYRATLAHPFQRIAAMCGVLGVGLGATPVHAQIGYTDLYTLGTPAGLGAFSLAEHEAAMGGQVVGQASTAANASHALLWSGSTPVDLNPTGFGDSHTLGTNGSQQVGYGAGPTTGGTHALLWTGTASSVVDLNPAGYVISFAGGTSGTQQVGWGAGPTTSNSVHALLWNGTAASAVSLRPIGYDFSYAYGTNGTQQVGTGSWAGEHHALLWNGTANSAVDLHPAGFTESYAFSTNGTRQVGEGYGPSNGNQFHALLWTGTAASVVDLNPAGFSSSVANGISGTQEVGYGFGPAGTHALLWAGSAASAIDLQSVLPATFTGSSAYSISGDTVYGLALDTSNNYHAIAWTIPAPSSLGLLALTGGGAVLRGRRRK
jgi:hypothetical protein